MVRQPQDAGYDAVPRKRSVSALQSPRTPAVTVQGLTKAVKDWQLCLHDLIVTLTFLTPDPGILCVKSSDPILPIVAKDSIEKMAPLGDRGMVFQE